MMYGMKRTTVFLPEELKADLQRIAVRTGRTQADLIRDGVARVCEEYGEPPPKPTLPLFSSGDPTLADRVDELLAGDPERGIPAFGED
jgi:hypothetical protein